MTLAILPSYNNIKVGTLEALYKVDLDQTYTLVTFCNTTYFAKCLPQ